MINAKVKGLEGLEKALLGLSKEYDNPKYALQAMRPAMKAAGNVIADEIEATTPVDEGDLKRSTGIKIKKTNSKDKRSLGDDAVIHVEAGWMWPTDESLWFQSLAVEFGTSNTPAQPTLLPALERKSTTATDTFIEVLVPSIEKKAKSLEKKFNKVK